MIYRFKCDRLESDEEYIRESSNTFEERFEEQLKAPFPIYDNSDISGHTTTVYNFNIVEREDQNLTRAIKESLDIRINNPFLNKNIGKYLMPDVWIEILLNTPEPKLK